ncbi:hypothetical protein BMT54_05120 [Pasteurellaceae bacterium 15-036681]|nr:hypothetical protein BMT54_05120 [Pasteurellaceae bacterium 15-036681]
MVSQKAVIQAFERLYHAYHDKRFTKSLNFTKKTEQDLLPLVRNYLLGYFDYLEPEVATRVTMGKSSRIDFMIDNVAVEFAVRAANRVGNNLKADKNKNEVKKLITYSDHSLLILFDFRKNVSHLEVMNTLIEYRNIPSLGRGNHHRYPFTVVYFFRNEEGELCGIPRRIRVPKRPIALREYINLTEQQEKTAKFISRRGIVACEYELGKPKQVYCVEVRIESDKLTIEYQDNSGKYYQFKGNSITGSDRYELVSSDNSNDKAIVSVFIDEDEKITIEGTLYEDGEEKGWLIEDE